MAQPKTSHYEIKFEGEVKYVVIDIGPGRKAMTPPNDILSFHVLVFEPRLEMVFCVSRASSRMKAMVCAVDSYHGIKEIRPITVGNENKFPKYNQIPKISANKISQLAPVIPLKDILEAIPKTAEIFVRVDAENLGLSAAIATGEILSKVSLFKKQLDKDSEDSGDSKGKWDDYMNSLGFDLIKFECLSSEKKELVWVNRKLRLGANKEESVLLRETNNTDKTKINLDRIKNHIRFSFGSLFFNTHPVQIVTDNVTETLNKENCSWKIASTGSTSIPKDVISIELPDTPPRRIYISHAFFKGGLHCGHCESTKGGESIFCWSKYQLITGDFQLLCGTSFGWAKPIKGKIPPKAVVGGRDNTGDALFPTLVRKDERAFIGKVSRSWLVTEGSEKKMKCQYYDGETKFTGDFDVLVFQGDDKVIV